MEACPQARGVGLYMCLGRSTRLKNRRLKTRLSRLAFAYAIGLARVQPLNSAPSTQEVIGIPGSRFASYSKANNV